MSSWNPDSWFWDRAFAWFDRADRMQRQANQRRPTGPVWEPSADVFETAGELHIEVAVPGVDPQSVSTTIEGDTLVVAGTRRIASRYRRAHVHRLEIPYGDFERRVALPPGSYEVVEHELIHGCLILTLAKRPGGSR